METRGLFRCPDCGAGVEPSGAGLACPDCRARFGADMDQRFYRLVSSKQSELVLRVNDDWTRHWEKSRPGFHAVTAVIRRRLTAPLVQGGLERLLDGAGKTFLEAGSGTSETSVLVDFSGHVSISLDISDAVLRRNVNPQIRLQGDLFNLPLQDGSIDAVFNIGVHEHYSETQNAAIFQEFLRVLKPGGRVVLFWPWYWAPLMVLTRAINSAGSLLLGRKYELYPNQYWEIKRFSQAHHLLAGAGFAHVRHYLSIVDLFSMIVLDYDKRG